MPTSAEKRRWVGGGDINVKSRSFGAGSFRPRHSKIVVQVQDLAEINRVFKKFLGDDKSSRKDEILDLHQFLESFNIVLFERIPPDNFAAISQGIQRLKYSCVESCYVTWDQFKDLLQDENKGNMELPIEPPSEKVEYSKLLGERNIDYSMDEGKIEAVPERPRSSFKESVYLNESAARQLQNMSLTSSTVQPEINGVVEQKIKKPSWKVEANKIYEDVEETLAPEEVDFLKAAVGVESEEEVVEEEEESTEAILIDCRFESIDEGEVAKLREYLRARNPSNVVIDKYNIDMTELKLSCLRSGVWLNDEIISFYMLLLQDRDTLLCEKYPGRKTSHFFNNFFMERLLITDRKYNYSNVQRWTKKFDIFSKHKIFVPINLSNTHWALGVVYMEAHEIHYYDSMSGRGDQFLNALRSWVADESLNKRKVELDMSDWKLISREAHVPQQMNGSDCGVFTIVCADFLSDDLPLEYSQQDMSFFREKIGCDILRGALKYDIVTTRTS